MANEDVSLKTDENRSTVLVRQDEAHPPAMPQQVLPRPPALTKDELFDLIVEAKARKATVFSLRKKWLGALPPELFDLTELIALDLSYNQLTVLPPEISRLKKLEQLNLCSNNFVTLPPELFQLERLTILGLGDL